MIVKTAEGAGQEAKILIVPERFRYLPENVQKVVSYMVEVSQKAGYYALEAQEPRNNHLRTSFREISGDFSNKLIGASAIMDILHPLADGEAWDDAIHSVTQAGLS